MRGGGLYKERARGAAPVGSRERTRCSRRQSPPSSPSRASGTQLVGEGGGEGETETGESRGPGLREGEMLRRGAHPFSHTRCTRKSRMVPRAALVSPGAPRGGGGVRSRAGPRSPASRSARLGSHDQSAQSRLGLPRSGSLFKAMGSALLLPSLLFRFFFHPPPFSSPGPPREPHVGAESGMLPFHPIVT